MTREFYQKDVHGLARIAKSSAMSKAMVAAATVGMTEAVRKSPHKSGVYRDSFNVRPVDVEVNGEIRKGAVLENTSDHGTEVEWGTTRMAGRHILRDHAIPAIERLSKGGT